MIGEEKEVPLGQTKITVCAHYIRLEADCYDIRFHTSVGSIADRRERGQ